MDALGRMRRTALVLIAVASALACGPEHRPNVLLVTLDTTRVDRLGTYGYALPTSPNIDRLAEDSIVYSNAVATSSWTLPSHASLFTGKYPMSHGARLDPRGPLFLTDAIDGPEAWKSYRARGISPDEVTLAARLGAHGYDTAAVVAGPWMKRIFGLNAGFDLYDDSLVTDVGGARASDVSNRALAFLRTQREQRFLLFLNYYDPHAPYAPPPEFTPRFPPPAPQPGDVRPAALNYLYDAEIQYLDHHFGRVLDGLRKLALYDDTLIVVTADHGELLGENGRWSHGHYLTEEELRVPLIVKFPGSERRGERRDERLSITGVFALVLDRVGLEVPTTVQARIPPEPDAPVIAETNPLPMFSRDGAWRALYDGNYKLLWSSQHGYRLHDLSADPTERIDLTREAPVVADRLQATLDRVFALAPAPGPAGDPRSIDADTQRALESLGYLE